MEGSRQVWAILWDADSIPKSYLCDICQPTTFKINQEKSRDINCKGRNKGDTAITEMKRTGTGRSTERLSTDPGFYPQHKKYYKHLYTKKSDNQVKWTRSLKVMIKIDQRKNGNMTIHTKTEWAIKKLSQKARPNLVTGTAHRCSQSQSQGSSGHRCALASKTEDLSSITRTRIVEGENLTSTCVPWHRDNHKHNTNK